ncbi:MAG: hypothetical protein KatS3mg108_3350 [Isosphaeraceae bacterium]|jgi:hypothetical protein|nr:MAG: hypothetical protein KatS3mg108_3350 [Isosphaeraceae bacterium]
MVKGVCVWVLWSGLGWLAGGATVSVPQEVEKTAGVAEASRVTIEGQGIRLLDALGQLQRQSGNVITDLREVYGGEATNPPLDLTVRERTFFEALEEIARQAEVGLTFYTGDGSIGVVPRGMELGEVDGAGGASRAPVELVGPFRVVLRRIATVRDLATGQARGSATLELAWEPRLRPMLLALRADGLRIVDDQGRVVEPEVAEESLSTVLRPENPIAEIHVTMAAPERSARTLRELSVRGEVTLPADLRRFRFERLDVENASQEQGATRVTLVSTEVEENVWKVNVRLEMAGEGPVFESFQQGLFNNRLWLQKGDGSRFEHNGGFSTTESGGGVFGFEYLFVNVPGMPGDWQFVYEAPGRVVRAPFEVTFRDVPLP